jgi:UrcA family protein
MEGRPRRSVGVKGSRRQERPLKAILVQAAVAAIASMLVGRVAIAQNVEEVTVQAKHGLTTKVVGRTSSGIPLTDISLSYDASAAGLDLASNAGAAELARRINAAARAACGEIGRQYPEATPSDAQCATAAARDAMVKARKLVAAAQSK